MFFDDNGIKLEIYDRDHPWRACRERGEIWSKAKTWGNTSMVVPWEELLKKASEKRSKKNKENQGTGVTEAKGTEKFKEPQR